jgi:DNA-binding MarR family transcriptional regulator
VNVRLTQEGHDLIMSLKGKIKTIEDKISSEITPEEKETLFRIVSKIAHSRERNYNT